jgi:hypothetical protein
MIPLSKFSINTPEGAELHIALARGLYIEPGAVMSLPLDGACGEVEGSFVPAGQIAPELAFEDDESRWDLLEPLRLIENVEYIFSVIVPMPKEDFERRSRVVGDGLTSPILVSGKYLCTFPVDIP